jgi:hypothetical protein
MWLEGLLLSASLACGVLGYRAARSRGRAAIRWALVSACLLLPVGVVWQLPNRGAPDADRHWTRIAVAGGWFALVTGILHATFPRTIPFSPLARVETALANLASPSGPVPTQCLNGDLSPAILLAGIGLSFCLLCFQRPAFAALILGTAGAILGIGVELADRTLQVLRFTGGEIPALPRAPFAIATMLLIAGSLSIGWLHRTRPAAQQGAAADEPQRVPIDRW